MRGTRFSGKTYGKASACHTVWRETRSYGRLAKQLGNPQATTSCGRCEWKEPDYLLSCLAIVLLDRREKLTRLRGADLRRKPILLSLEERGRKGCSGSRRSPTATSTAMFHGQNGRLFSARVCNEEFRKRGRYFLPCRNISSDCPSGFVDTERRLESIDPI